MCTAVENFSLIRAHISSKISGRSAKTFIFKVSLSNLSLTDKVNKINYVDDYDFDVLYETENNNDMFIDLINLLKVIL